ncbi:MAG: GyrI-like domain-containing protein [Eubacteriales bacterium]|nr:GyrI-like domain-containing protein [Eubacteriales bacterium]MDD3882140.1 GyrI-like domain-containing protein [Eubacteriales bacterium]MDD4513245.1 GyrI-like domain-containing protein [Eubacteriales bacterium]
MPFDFKKEYKEFYMPPRSAQIVNLPRLSYIAVSGKGDPNSEKGEYQRALSVLYAVAYTLKMSGKSGHKLDGFFDYVVPPLEGFWWQKDTDGMDYSRKRDFNWISVIRLPDFVSESDFDWAKSEAERKKKLDCSNAQMLAVEEGLCVQIMHSGAYDDEPASVAEMDRYIAENGYANDMTEPDTVSLLKNGTLGARLHHEIYLSDARKCAPDKLKTVIRHPIKKL